MTRISPLGTSLQMIGNYFPTRGLIRSDRGIKWTMALGCRTRPSGYIGWGAGTTTLCQSLLYPPVRDYESGYSIQPFLLRYREENVTHKKWNVPMELNSNTLIFFLAESKT
jgi:hypothetical protein